MGTRVGSPVVLHVYDLSQGMARQMSPMMLGKQIDGIWHTGIVVYSTEYYFGGGICADPPARTPYGTPYRNVDLGVTRKTQAEFESFLASMSGRFSMQTYHILENNCNNFSDACARFLLGDSVGIPSYIIDLPREALDTPMGAMLRPMIESMQGAIRDQSSGHEVHLNAAAPSQARTSMQQHAPHGNVQSQLGHRQGTSDAPPSQSASPAGSLTALSLASKPIILTRSSRADIVAKLREFYPDYQGDLDGQTLRVSELLGAERGLALGKAFPALDLLRLAAAQDSLRCSEVAAATSELLAKYVLAGPDVPRPSRMMALRVAANCFAFESGAKVLTMQESIGTILDAVAESMSHEHPAVSKAAVVLAFNVAGAHIRHPQGIPCLTEEQKVRLLYAAVERVASIEAANSAEEAYPLLGSIVMAIHDDVDARELVRAMGVDLGPFENPSYCKDQLTRRVADQLRGMLEQG